MKKRTAVKILSFCMAATFVLFGECIVLKNRADYYKGIVGNGYESAAREFTSSIGEIDTELQKAKYINSSNALNKVSSSLLVNCETAKSALSKLPCNQGEIKTINKYLSQIGNYASYLAGKLSTDGEISDRDFEALSELSEVSSIVNHTVDNLSAQLGNTEYWIKSVDSLLSNEIDDNTFANIIFQKDEEITNYPVLVYDGPYSDTALNSESVFLKDKQDVDANTASTVLEKITGIPRQYFEYSGISKGKIESYNFSGENISCAISVKGGYPVYYSNGREIGDLTLSQTQAVEKAYRFLNKIGEVNFTHTYYFEDEGVCTINFAYKDGSTVCYTDLVKIGVAMDNGDIVFLECSPYLTNHKSRNIETPEYTFEQAKEKLSKNLSVEAEDLAMIPLDGREILCFEFKCIGKNGENINVYINTKTLEEEQILLLIITDGGTLSK